MICSDFLVLVRILDEPQLSSGLLCKAGEETITITNPAGDKCMNKFLQVLSGSFLVFFSSVIALGFSLWVSSVGLGFSLWVSGVGLGFCL